MQTDDEFCWPGGESYAYFRRRVLRAVHAIARRQANQRVVIVTHAGVVNQVLGWMHGQKAGRWENFRPGNASITTILKEGSSWRLETFDDRTHLR
jgi:broad specificity phosphatase PhoE